MSREEMVGCDLAKCGKKAPNPTDGYVTASFDGRIFDFCSSAHQAKWEDELRKLDPNRKPAKSKAKAKR